MTMGTIDSHHRVLENTPLQYRNRWSSRCVMQLYKQEWIPSSQHHCSVISNISLLHMKNYMHTLWSSRSKRSIIELSVSWELGRNGKEPRSRNSRMLLINVLHFCCRGCNVCPCHSVHHDSLFAITSYASCLLDAFHYEINSNGAKHAWLVTIASRACLKCTVRCTYRNSVQSLIQMKE